MTERRRARRTGVALAALLGAAAAGGGCAGEDHAAPPSTTRALTVATYPASTAVPTTVVLPPTAIPPSVRLERDVAYDTLNRLDIYAPRSAGSYPTIVMFPGRNSDKTSLAALAGSVAEGGAVVFAVGYRGHDDQAAAVADGRCAVQFAQANGPRYGSDGGPPVLVGVSTGAQLAVGEGLDGPWKHLAADGGCSATAPVSGVRAVVGVVGAYNALDSASPDYATFSPFSQAASAPAVPLRLVEGARDQLAIDRSATVAFRDALTAAGHGVTTAFVDDIPNLALVGLTVDATTHQLTPIGPDGDHRGLQTSAREILAAARPS